MNGGYGAGGGGRRSGGYGGQAPDGRGQRRQQSGGQPPWDDPSRQQGQPAGRPGQGSGQPRGQGPGQPPGRGQGYGQGYGQPGGGPDPRSQAQRPGGGSQQYPRTGPQPGQRGSGPQQASRGYDPRGTAPRRAADGYPADGYPPDSRQLRGDARSGQEDHGGREPDPGDGSFLPGFGRREEFHDARAPRRGRGGGYAGEAGGYDDEYGDYDDRRDPRGPRDGRGGDTRPGRVTRGRERGHGRDDWDDGGERRPRRGPVRRLAPWIALLVIFTPLIVGGVYVYNLYENKYHPADYAGAGTGPTVAVQVNSGDTATSLGPRLVALGVVDSSRAFVLAAEHSTSTAGLEVGYYKLNHHMQASLAYAALLNPKNRVQLTVTIPEGKRASQVVALLAKGTNIPAANFQQVIDHPAQLGLPSYAKGKVEGYLYPATYTIQPNETALQILQAMVQRYDVEAQQVKLASAAAAVGLTPEQVIIEASMAQAEGGSLSDYPRIARVIINRLAIGMHLQFDSTVLYGLGKYAVSATFKQINTPGPYNTYLNPGLPPGPICNPGNAAIQAILHPATGNWLYFLTYPGGKSVFSVTNPSG